MLKVTVLSHLTKIRLISVFRYFNDQLNIDYEYKYFEQVVDAIYPKELLFIKTDTPDAEVPISFFRFFYHQLMTYSTEIYAKWDNFCQQVFQVHLN